MRVHGGQLHLIVLVQLSCCSRAFSPLSIPLARPLQTRSCHSPSRSLSLSRSTRRFGSQWDDDEDDVTTKRTSFEQAGEDLNKEEDEEKMNSIGEFDANPAYSADTVDQIRAAIKKRADALGIEESQEQIEYRQNAEERANEAREQFIAGGGTGQMQQILDLSKISYDSPGGKVNDGMPTMFYDPEDEMTPEQMAEADPVGELPLIQQAIETIKKSEFPSFGDATLQVLTLILSIVGTASLLIGYDYVIRNFYQWANVLPTDDEMKAGIEVRMKRQGVEQSNDKDLMESLKNFEQDVPSEL